MSRFFSYINTSKKILETYNGTQPFSFHLKKYFSAHKNIGSKDRKTIATLCYNWFRTYHLFKGQLSNDVLISATFLCHNTPQPILAVLAPQLNEQLALSISEKLALLKLNVEQVFPFYNELGQIEAVPFITSFFRQPLLFLRIRPKKEKRVLSILQAAAIPFTLLENNTIALLNSTAIEKLLKLNKDVVIQDKSSQKVFHYFKNQPPVLNNVNVWDCCTASGGKSILLFDALAGKINLTVSDIRKNILHNCNKRLQDAGINIYHAFEADLTQKTEWPIDKNFSIIICDVPCTGSGTWARTPEQLAFFKTENLLAYTTRQKLIATHAAAYLKKEGLFFYITCSVFKQENEGVVAHILKETSLCLLQSQYIKGYEEQADSLFVAVFKL